MVTRHLSSILFILLNTNACRSSRIIQLTPNDFSSENSTIESVAAVENRRKCVSIVETHMPINDNFIFLGSKLMTYNCSGDLSQRTIVIHEDVKLGERDCKLGKTNLNIAYRTCTIDEYLALQSCQETSNSIVCSRIRSSVEGEDPCQSLTSVMKAEYCLQGLFANPNLYYGPKSYDSLCHFLADSSNSFSFSAKPDFSLLIADGVPTSSVDRTIAIYKIRKTAMNTCDNLQDLIESKVFNYSIARRLIMGETTLIDNRTLICITCSESYTMMSGMTFTSKVNDMPNMAERSDQCPGAKKFLTIDMTKIIKAVEPLTYTRLSITFYQGKSQYGIFDHRFITADIPISLKSDSNECHKSHTTIIVCSITLPQKSSLFANVDSITWSLDGRTIDNKSELIVPSEKSDDKFSLYVMYRGNYTCEVAIQVFLTFPSKIEIVPGSRFKNHIFINVIIVSIAFILLLICILIMRFKNSRPRRREKTQSLSISPIKFNKVFVQKKGGSSAQMEALKTQIEQLRMEASIPRKRISEVSKDLIDYCEKNRANDVLITGIADSHNPFQEKKSCVIL